MDNATATKHLDSCNHAFGRRTPGCPRCAELASGAAPRRWVGGQRKADEGRMVQAIRAHRCSAACGPVCTAFSW